MEINFRGHHELEINRQLVARLRNLFLDAIFGPDTIVYVDIEEERKFKLSMLSTSTMCGYTLIASRRVLEKWNIQIRSMDGVDHNKITEPDYMHSFGMFMIEASRMSRQLRQMAQDEDL